MSSKKSKLSVDTPVMITIFIVVISIIILSVWKIFFDTSIKNSWRLTMNDDNGEYFYQLTFRDNNEFDYSFGGITYTGRYSIDRQKSSVTLVSSSYGYDNLNSRFNYQFSGNSFSGRKLSLINEDNDELLFTSNNNYVPVITYYNDFSPDEALLGSWLYKDTEKGYNYTFTFYDDGRYEYLCEGSRHIGAYKTDGKILDYNLITDSGNIDNETMKYSITDNKLTFITDSFTNTLTKTDNKFSFENKIK